MNPVMISSETGQWFDEDEVTQYKGSMMDAKESIYVTKKGTFVHQRRDGYYDILDPAKALAWLRRNKIEITESLHTLLFPKDKQV